MVKDVAVNRISASQAAWRFAQNPDDLKLRDSRFDSWYGLYAYSMFMYV